MVFICEYCNSNFSCKSALTRHSNSAKKCIQIRNDKLDVLKCSFCDYETTRKSSLESHNKIHFNELLHQRKERDIEIENLNKQLKLLKELLEKQMEKPTTIKNSNSVINHNKTNNTLNIKYDIYKQILTPLEELEEKLPVYITQHFTEKSLEKGVKGFAEITSNIIHGNPRYCLFSDTNGKNAYYLTTEGDLIKDDNARKITELAITALDPHLYQLASNKSKKIYEQLASTSNEDDSKELNKQLSKIKNNVTNIKELRNDNTLFRKHLANKGYISNEKIFQNMDNPGLLLEEIREPQLLNLKVRLMDVLDQKNAKYEISKISDEMMKYILYDVNTISDFIINKFLLVDGELIYDYDEVKNCFIFYDYKLDEPTPQGLPEEVHYNDDENPKLKQYECDGEILYNFINKFSLMQMLNKKCKAEYDKIRTISKEEFVNVLKRKLLIRRL